MKLLYQCPPKLLLNKEMNRQFRILGLLYHRLLNLMHLQLQTMKMKWKAAFVQAQNEVIMTALTRNLTVLLAKSLPLVPQPVGGMALTCRQGQEEEIYQQSGMRYLYVLSLCTHPYRGSHLKSCDKWMSSHPAIVGCEHVQHWWMTSHPCYL